MTAHIFTGDCRTILPQFPSDRVHCCVTSPPYWGLRNYGVAPLVWGGDKTCQHKFESRRYYVENSAASSEGSVEAFSKPGEQNAQRLKDGRWREDATCVLCGAWRGALGLEPTPQMFVQNLVDIFREVRRVLRPDGTFWLNLGDSYSRSDKKGGSGFGGKNQKYLGDNYERARSDIPPGLKTKDLIGIPWRVAFALQADGWYLRQDIIWHKPNPMPESVRDRCTKAHEYIFMFAKSERYYYDASAIEEARTQTESRPTFRGGAYVNGNTFDNSKGGISTDIGNVKFDKQSQHGRRHAGFNARWDATEIHGSVKTTRNKRSVWTVAPKPFKEAHFATFPPDLIEPCILAGSPAGGLVLDPFGGAGTTALVAEKHRRTALSIELNPTYVELQHKRLSSTSAPSPASPPPL